MDLQKTLSELSDLLPVVPLRVSELLESGQALQRRAEDVLERSERLPGATGELRDSLEEQVREAVEQVREAHDERQERLEELQAASSALTESLEQWREELEQAAEKARAGLGGLQAAVKDDVALGRSEEDGTDAADANGNGYRTSFRDLQLLHEDYRQAHDEMGSRLDEAALLLASAFGSASERMRELQQGAVDTVADLYDTTREGKKELAATLASATEAMQDALQAAGADLGDRLAAQADAARERVREAGAHAGGTVEELGVAGEGAAAVRDVLDPLFSGVSSLLHPVETAVDAVKAAASLVGLHLP